MKITAVVVTCNRLELLPRALKSVSEQSRKPDFVYVVSNSTKDNYLKEKEICEEFRFKLVKNYRTENYAGALNTGVEEIVKRQGISDNIYFASLDDDDIWLPDYLKEIEANNTEDFDLIATNYLRKSDNENLIMTLPKQLSENDFLKGNPGIGGSNTFIKLETLLKAGCFDEALHSSVDRDFFVRVFQQKPHYQIIQKHLVTAYTDKDRERLTTNREKKIKSFRVFFYKYQHLMSDADKKQFFQRAKNYFGIEQSEVDIPQQTLPSIKKIEFGFKNKGDYKFIIGFIAGDEIISERIAKQIAEKDIPIDLVVMIDDTPKGKTLDQCERILKGKNIDYEIIGYDQTNEQLADGYYGKYFEKYPEINSIPLGRTILHHHLYTLTKHLSKPVYWIIDDDISFETLSTKEQRVNLFDIINENLGEVDAIIGGISQDPPVPTLSCIRSQLVDFFYSQKAENAAYQDVLNIRGKLDYYYDLSDLHTNHLEVPIFHQLTDESDLQKIFAGKSLSRPALQRALKAESKTITKRGANTLVFNRELLKEYPVINLEVKNQLARRGDLLWALFNQLISGFKIIEHTFSLNHNRPLVPFNLKKQLEKSAYDIIGYAFNKGILKVIEHIKDETETVTQNDVFEKLNQETYYQYFLETYNYFLERRKTRFLMNYYRIIGLTKLLSEDFTILKSFYSQFLNSQALSAFHLLLVDAQNEDTLKSFFNDFKLAIENYNKSTSDVYKKACQRFEERIREAEKEIENYQNKICNTTYCFLVEQNNATLDTTEQFLFTTSNGVFVYDSINYKYIKILDGKYYGLTKHQNTWIASRSNNKGDRSHIENKRISDICSFSINSNYEVENLKVLLYGIPGEVHQIDIANKTLFIPHTDFNQVLFIDIETCLNSKAPLSIMDCNHIELDIFPSSHLNSVFVSNNDLHLISHNFTMKTGKLSDRIIVNLNSSEVQSIPLNAHSAHNIYVKGDDSIFCDSNNKTLCKNQLAFFKSDKFLRGLSITEEFFFVGGSDICNDNNKRFSNNPSIYILNNKSGSHLKTINFVGLGDIYEIRQLHITDYSLSQNNK